MELVTYHKHHLGYAISYHLDIYSYAIRVGFHIQVNYAILRIQNFKAALCHWGWMNDIAWCSTFMETDLPEI